MHHPLPSLSSLSAALRASLTQSRQTWTHSAFSRFKPQTANNGGHKAQFTPVSEVSLAGVCTVSIGPHIFLDTKFFTVLNSDTESLAIKAESSRDRSRSPSRQRTTRHQVVLEFKENSGTQWLFPEEASLEFFPANDRDSAQITASFNLPLRDQSRQGRPQPSQIGDQDIAVDMTISHATTALWEGLELAAKGPRTVHRSGAHRSHVSGHRSRTSSTYDEDPSEILGSGKKASQNNESFPTKRKQDGVVSVEIVCLNRNCGRIPTVHGLTHFIICHQKRWTIKEQQSSRNRNTNRTKSHL